MVLGDSSIIVFVNEHEIPDVHNEAAALPQGEYRITNVDGVDK
jgi:hypothetical protein